MSVSIRASSSRRVIRLSFQAGEPAAANEGQINSTASQRMSIGQTFHTDPLKLPGNAEDLLTPSSPARRDLILARPLRKRIREREAPNPAADV